MFDIGWTEIAIIGLVALIIIGPKDLPRVLRTLGQWTAKARSLTREFRGHVDDMIRESELDEVKREFDGAAEGGVRDYLENTIDPNGELRETFNYTAEELDDDFLELDELSEDAPEGRRDDETALTSASADPSSTALDDEISDANSELPSSPSAKPVEDATKP